MQRDADVSTRRHTRRSSPDSRGWRGTCLCRANHTLPHHNHARAPARSKHTHSAERRPETSSGYESDPVGTALQRSPHRERLHARQHAKGAARVITAGRGPSRPSSPVGFPPAGHTTQHVFAPARSAGRKAGQQGEQAHVRQQLGSGGTDCVLIPVQRHGCRHAAHTSHATKRTVGGGCVHVYTPPRYLPARPELPLAHITLIPRCRAAVGRMACKPPCGGTDVATPHTRGTPQAGQ